MTIYISTNVFIPTSFEDVFTLLSKLEDPYAVGIEVFPNWKDEKFVKAIEMNIEELKKITYWCMAPISILNIVRPKVAKNMNLQWKKSF